MRDGDDTLRHTGRATVGVGVVPPPIRTEGSGGDVPNEPAPGFVPLRVSRRRVSSMSSITGARFSNAYTTTSS